MIDTGQVLGPVRFLAHCEPSTLVGSRSCWKQQHTFLQRHRALKRRGPVLRPCASQAGVPFRQRLHTAKLGLQAGVERARQAVLTSPPVGAVLHILAFLRAKLDPLFRLAAYVEGRYEVARNRFLESYAEFTSTETKRKWEWKRRSEKENGLWTSVVNFIGVWIFFMGYEVVAPVSFFWAIFVPAHVAWSVYDRPLLSPVTVALLLMLPLKFVPGAPARWF